MDEFTILAWKTLFADGYDPREILAGTVIALRESRYPPTPADVRERIRARRTLRHKETFGKDYLGKSWVDDSDELKLLA